MAGKLLELAIAIKGKIEKSLPESMRKAIAEAGSVQQKYSEISKTIAENSKKLAGLQGAQEQIKQFAQLKQSLQGLGAQYEQSKAKTAQLAAEYHNAQTAAAALKTKFDTLKAAQQAAKGTVPKAEYAALTAQVKQAKAELKAAEQATKASGQAFNQAKASAARLKAEIQQKQIALQRLRDDLKAAGVSTGNLAQEEIRLRREIEQTKKAIDDAAAAKKKLDDIQKRQSDAKTANFEAQQKFAYASNNLSAGISTVQSFAAPLVEATNVAMEFEATLSKVRAITGANDADMQKLTATAQELGEKTMFSAKQSAEAMTFLGMAGWKTEQIIGAMPGLLDLAASGGVDLATTADIISDDLTAFGMSADQAGRMADVFAAASSNANTNIQLMGETFKYAGAVAGAAKYKLEDVAIATGLMANAGVKGTQSGTSLRAMMTNMAKPSKQAAEAMDALGISIKNSDGTTKPFMQQMLELRGIFGKLTETEKMQYAASIAGKEAMSGFLAIVNASDSDFKSLTDAVYNSNGAAKRMAETMQNNAQGAITTFKSAVEGAQIAVGKLMLPVLGAAASAATKCIGVFTSWAKANPKLVAAIIAVTAAIAGAVVAALALQAAIAGWALMASTITLVKTSLEGVSIASKLASMAFSPWSLAIVAVAAAVYLLYRNWDKIAPYLTSVMKTIEHGILVAWQPLKKILDDNSGAFETLKSALAVVGEYIDTVVLAAFMMLADIIGSVITTAVQLAVDVIGGLVQALGGVIDFITGVFTGDWDKAWNGVVNIFKGIFGGLFDFAKDIIGGIANLVGSAISGFDAFKRVSGMTAHTGDAQGMRAIRENAAGGIYGKGAFLTTFAEKSAEAAIPLDGSSRAISLWRQAGDMLGMPQMSMPEVAAPTSSSSPFSIEYRAPSITINGNADNSTVEQMRRLLTEHEAKFESIVDRAVSRRSARERRLSFA